MKKRYLGVSILALGTLFTLGACSHTEESGEIVNESNNETVYTDDSGNAIVQTTTDLKDDGFFKVIVGEGKNPKIKDIVSYDTEYENSDWDHITLNIDHAKIVNVLDFKDDDDATYKELVSLKYQLLNEDSSDKHITPDKAELLLKDGTKVNTEFFLNYWDDEILTQDEHKDGYIHFKVKDEHKLSDINQIKVTFKAKDEEGNETTHTYTIDFPMETAD